MHEQDITEVLKNANNLLKDWVYTDGTMKLKINFVNKSENPDPAYAKAGDSGFDLRASLSEDAILKPFQRALVPTGLYFQIPENFELQVRPRSGLALKNGVTVLNTPGTVDSGYRGEICVILINLGSEDFIIKSGDRIAQAVIAPVQTNNNSLFFKTQQLDDSERGATGFGSSGVK